METVTVPSETADFHKELKTPSIYEYSIKTPQGGDSTVPLMGDQMKEVTFILPADCFSFKHSFLNFEYITPAQGVDAYAWVWRDLLTLIDSVRLTTSKGVDIFRVPYFRMYSKLSKKDIKLEDFLTTSDEEYLYPNLGETSFGENKYSGGGVINNPLHYVYVTSASGANVAGTPIRVRFNLGKLLGIIFENHQSLYFPEELKLHIMFGPWRNIGFKNVNAVAGSRNDPTGGPAELTGAGLVLTEMRLMLALERQPLIFQTLKNTVDTVGLSVPVVTTYSDSKSIQSTQQTMDLSLSAGYGSKLRRIYYTCQRQAYVNDPTRRYNISNQTYNKLNNTWVPQNITSYYVMLDNKRISGEFDIDCMSGEDWLVNRRHLKNTVIQNRQQYALEWHHQEDFSGLRQDPNETFEGVPKSNITSGLDLTDKTHTITIFTRMATNDFRDHYIFAEVERELFIRKDKIGFFDAA